jgi:DNA-binding transcriptional MerR regulator
MIRIGYFSRLSQVPVKTLRYYDQIGLLKPAQVDPFTGYRYYAIGQLSRLNRILALKDLGLSLEQIGRILAGELTAAELRGMLRLRQAQLQEEVRAAEEMLARVEARLQIIEMEDTMPDYEVVIKTVKPMLVASRRVIVPTNDQVPKILGGAFDEVAGFLKQQKVEGNGPCLALWHSSPDSYTNEDVEAIFPIGETVLGNERIQVYELPEEEVAAVSPQGDFDNSTEGGTFTEGHAALKRWLQANGLRLHGAYREIYHDLKDRSQATVEVQFPIERV